MQPIAPNSDSIAVHMLRWGKMARKMPRSFDSDGVTYNMMDGEGGTFGKMLPGRGFVPSFDLKSLGIDRGYLPNVYDPSMYRKLEDEHRKLLEKQGVIERYGSRFAHFKMQHGAIASYDQIIAQRGSGFANDMAFSKNTLTTVAQNWSSLFGTATGMPGAGTYLATTAPTDGNLDRTTTGALSQYLSRAQTGSNKFYLLSFGYGAVQQINMAALVDIINHGGSYRLVATTAEIVATPTVTSQRQYATGNGVGNLLTFIVTTAGTPVAQTLTVTYVDQAGSSTAAPALTMANVACVKDTIFTSGASFTAANATGLIVPLAAASTGVQAVKQTLASVGTGSTGVLAHNVFYPLAFVPGLAANAYVERDATSQIDGIQELANVSGVIGCLQVYVLTNTTSTGVLTGYVKTVQG